MPRLLSMREASDELGGIPSPATMYRLAQSGNLPVKRIGRRIVISEARLEEWANTVGDARSHSYMDPKAPSNMPPAYSDGQS